MAMEDSAPTVIRMLVAGGGRHRFVDAPADPIEMGLLVFSFARQYNIPIDQMTVTVFRELITPNAVQVKVNNHNSLNEPN